MDNEFVPAKKYLIDERGYAKYCRLCPYNIQHAEEDKGWVGVHCCADRCEQGIHYEPPRRIK